MGFSARDVIKKGFSIWVRDRLRDHIPEPLAFPVTLVCRYRPLLTSGRHLWSIGNHSWAMGLQQRTDQKGSKCPICTSQGLDEAPMCVRGYCRRHQ